MTINLYSVKVNGEYDYIQNTVPTGSGTWLVSEDFSTYLKGESYTVVIGTPTTITKISATTDIKIQKNIYKTIESICSYLNNYFYSERQDTITSDYFYSYLGIQDSRTFNRYLANYGEYTFNSNALPVPNIVFQTGDLVQVRNAQRNQYISYSVVSSNTLTLDNTGFKDVTEYAMLMLMVLPQSVEDIISNMIYFDIYVRDGHTDLNSESIGNYSYSKDKIAIGGLGYPSSLLRGLDSFRIVRFN